jgi:hypothetical protein
MNRQEREKRVLADVERYGNVRDCDLPVLRDLIARKLVRVRSFEDYVGWEVVRS